ncbi:glycoside hydrolase family 104 protein [Burkholderia contaminans]|uniref:glycoside hydrolase family 24 protein n=1 Tax=Burkholderia contaminans TaxID=488447 RepID=UPI001CF5FEB2|nr:glycoside hydrolase family 104 protein [Burkholderia contaminans]MCA7919464.1 glycoside hydrolase family 104 protein [Burkholderia contaminans]UUX37208.1 glycoside hydrolase family 104 protein [Burkholderia contaminans]
MESGPVVLLLAAASLMLLGSQSAEADVVSGGSDYPIDPTIGNVGDFMGLSGLDSSPAPSYTSDPSANVSAFLYMLRMGESSNRYNVISGGQTFSNYSWHPNIVGSAGTTASGAYQFVYETWNRLAGEAGLTDFTPASQDAAAVQYLSDLGAMPYVEAGDVQGAWTQINARGTVWQALPNARGGNRSPSQLIAWYQSAGGVLA